MVILTHPTWDGSFRLKMPSLRQKKRRNQKSIEIRRKRSSTRLDDRNQSLLKAVCKWRMQVMKSPNRSVPSFRMWRSISRERMSEFNLKPERKPFTVFSLVSAHACNSIFIALIIWNEMDCLNRLCSADLVLCTVSCTQYAQWIEPKRQISSYKHGQIHRENTVLSFMNDDLKKITKKKLHKKTRKNKKKNQLMNYPVTLSHFLDPPGNHPRRAIFPEMCKINQSSVDFHCKPLWSLWLDWFIGFVPPDLFFTGAGLKWLNMTG